MRPVDQTRFGGPSAPIDERGDCLNACVASIFEWPLESLSENTFGEGWYDSWEAWFVERNILPVTFTRAGWATSEWKPRGYGILDVPSRTVVEHGEPVRHAVVWRDGAVVWDPNPRSRRLGTYSPDDGAELTFFLVIDPSRPISAPIESSLPVPA